MPVARGPGAPLRERGRPDAELALRGAATVRDAFEAYEAEFLRITRRARQRFEARDWRGTQHDALERLELRPRSVSRAVDELREVLGPGAEDRALRNGLKAAFDREVRDRPDPELART